MGEVQTISRPEPAYTPSESEQTEAATGAPAAADGQLSDSPLERIADIMAASVAVMAPKAEADAEAMPEAEPELEAAPAEPLPRFAPADYWTAAGRELMRFSSYRMSRNLRALDKFVTCRSGTDVVKAASEAASGTLDDYASEFHRLVDLGREALSPAGRA